MALNSRGRRMSEKIKMVIVQYLLMHLSVEAIRPKLKNFHSYVISRQGLYYFIKQWRSGKGLRRTRNNSGNSVKLKSIHLKFMDMWLAKNNELTTEMLKRKLFEVFGINVSPSLIRKRRSELGWKTVVSKTCQLISHKNKKVRKVWCTDALKNREDFRNVVFVDESTVEMSSFPSSIISNAENLCTKAQTKTCIQGTCMGWNFVSRPYSNMHIQWYHGFPYLPEYIGEKFSSFCGR
uniref:Uncharacterized protein LOC111107689 n=1 Tax=Crassostrea virginica TaxID=6565 RepID=A0A8B8B5M9_CRAVI|nr:uncharacterized protein LOC111107689 [Crassostrea virginica]